MALTQAQLATQMLAQLRLLDPSVSAEVGTPERKIIDTVAQALADAQVDLTQLAGALDVDAKYGASLDRFLSLFGFGRRMPTYATGIITFSRSSPSTMPIRIPAYTQIMAGNTEEGGSVLFETQFEAVLAEGTTSIQTAIRAVHPGSAGNVAAHRITQWSSQAIYGISDIDNPIATTGGVDAESDEELKVRFKNTVFRNLAGTADQYMALAASAQFTTRANIVGPISRYTEYLQVPPVSDVEAYDVNPIGTPEGGGLPLNPLETGHGNPGEYTTALSTIPYSKHTYETVPSFVSNGQTGAQVVFYREDIDWRLNTTSLLKNRGDAYRFAHSDVTDPDLVLGLDPTSTSATYKPNVTFYNIFMGLDVNVVAIRPNGTVLFEHSYMSTASRNNWERNVTNCVDVFIDGENPSVASTVIPAPGTATRTAFVNNPASKFNRLNYRRVGEPDIPPTVGHLLIPLFFEPVIDLPENIQIDEGELHAVFIKGVHYWAVEDITELHGSIRVRSGIEWDQYKVGWQSAEFDIHADDIPLSTWALRDFDPTTSIAIDNYTFDKNIIDLQSVYESNKQVTTDILVHRARTRWLKLDVTVTYNKGYNTDDTNSNMRDALLRYMARQPFGAVVQLSDLLQVVHGVAGVDNVRWSSDIPGAADLERVYDCTRDGRTRDDLVEGMNITGWTVGPDATAAHIEAEITHDNYAVMTVEPLTTVPQDLWASREYNVIAGYTYGVQAKVRSRGAQCKARIDTRWYTGSWSSWTQGAEFNSPDGNVWNEHAQTGLIAPDNATKLEFRIVFINTRDMQDIDRVAVLIGPSTSRTTDYVLRTEQLVYNSDFFLLDDELPRLCEAVADDDDEDASNRVFSVLPGLVVRTRAQNTWTRAF